MRARARKYYARMCFPIWEPALNASDGSRVDLRRDICFFTVVSRFARGNKAIVCSTYTLCPSELTGRAANRRSRWSGMRGALSKSVDLRPHPVKSNMMTLRLILSFLLWIILNFFFLAEFHIKDDICEVFKNLKGYESENNSKSSKYYVKYSNWLLEHENICSII